MSLGANPPINSTFGRVVMPMVVSYVLAEAIDLERNQFLILFVSALESSMTNGHFTFRHFLGVLQSNMVELITPYQHGCFTLLLAK